jgi:hypothetical protein
METIYAPKVTTIGSYAFQGCASALKTLTLGAVTSVNHSLYGIFYGNNENDMEKIDLFLSCEQKAMTYNSSTEYWTATGEAFDFGSTNEFIGYTFKSVTLAHPAEADDGDCTTAVKCANCDETAIEAKENHVSENPENKATCQKKLDVLLEQRKDLSTAIDQLIEDIEAGKKYMKVYKQMKMYNDPSTNPILYKNEK